MMDVIYLESLKRIAYTILDGMPPKVRHAWNKHVLGVAQTASSRSLGLPYVNRPGPRALGPG